MMARGFPKRYHERITKMFQTLKSRDEVEGSGIGLSVVQKIVHALGGRLTIRSPIDERGSAFIVSLPIESNRASDRRRGWCVTAHDIVKANRDCQRSCAPLPARIFSRERSIRAVRVSDFFAEPTCRM